MRRLFGVAVAALLGAGLAAAQQPVPVPAAPVVPVPAAPVVPVPAAPPAVLAQPPAGMVPVPAAPAAAAPAGAPIVVQGQPGCGTAAAAPAAGCATGDCGGAGKAKPAWFTRITAGTANPVSCGCLASERTFLFGSCRQFYTPGRTCGGTPIAYGCGSGECGYGPGHSPKDPCKHINTFHNR